MKLVSIITTPKRTINLVKFFNSNNKKIPLTLSHNFMEIVRDATSDGQTVIIDKQSLFCYRNSISIIEYEYLEKLESPFVDLKTEEGRLEARKRLGVLVYLLMQQKKGEQHQLLVNGKANVIGWFKTLSGSKRSTHMSWSSHFKKWDGGSRSLGTWYPYRRFWFRKKLE